MAHLHEVRDSDTHFIIDPITRVITNTAAAKNRLMQGDHNSEIFTFELPKTVEFHDMNLCNKVEIHYINVAADKTGTSTDVYIVEDFAPAEDDINAYAFSWRISDNATKYAGTLNFRIRFACTDGQGNYNYRWHTDIFKGITIADGFDNAPAVIKEYSDILEQWKRDLQNAVTDDKVNNAVNKYLDENPIDIPEQLPNPHALTLTGAVSAEYDGSQPLSVEIPLGGYQPISIVEEVSSAMIPAGTEAGVGIDTGATWGDVKNADYFDIGVSNNTNNGLKYYWWITANQPEAWRRIPFSGYIGVSRYIKIAENTYIVFRGNNAVTLGGAQVGKNTHGSDTDYLMSMGKVIYDFSGFKDADKIYIYSSATVTNEQKVNVSRTILTKEG